MIVTGKERTEVIGEKIGGKAIIAPALLDRDGGQRKADLEILTVIVGSSTANRGLRTTAP